MTDDAPYEEKYRVFKKESPRSADELPTWPEQLEPGTYFVIRSSDIFAPSAMYSYANNIRTFLEAHEKLSRGNGFPLLSFEQQENLQHLSDQLVELANDWEHRAEGKVPD